MEKKTGCPSVFSGFSAEGLEGALQGFRLGSRRDIFIVGGLAEQVHLLPQAQQVCYPEGKIPGVQTAEPFLVPVIGGVEAQELSAVGAGVAGGKIAPDRIAQLQVEGLCAGFIRSLPAGDLLQPEGAQGLQDCIAVFLRPESGIFADGKQGDDLSQEEVPLPGRERGCRIRRVSGLMIVRPGPAQKAEETGGGRNVIAGVEQSDPAAVVRGKRRLRLRQIGSEMPEPLYWIDLIIRLAQQRVKFCHILKPPCPEPGPVR